LAEKKEKLEEINEKYRAIKRLMKRNKNPEFIKNNGKLYFPFIGAIITNFKIVSNDIFRIKLMCKANSFLFKLTMQSDLLVIWIV
jgi:hypothetical protein